MTVVPLADAGDLLLVFDVGDVNAVVLVGVLVVEIKLMSVVADVLTVVIVSGDDVLPDSCVVFNIACVKIVVIAGSVELKNRLVSVIDLVELEL